MEESTVWSEIFSFDNIHSYAWGAVKLYESLCLLEEKGFDTVVFPSRGTTPFENLLFTAHQLYSRKREHKNRVVHALGEPFRSRKIRLPFTADCEQENGTASVRDFWVQVLKALLTGDLSSRELIYYQYLLSGFFGIEPGYGLSIKKPSENFVFVDTVVSGRAICEIMDSFENRGLDKFHVIILVDENGEKLREPYKSRLGQLEALGKVTRININLLFTEDKGPVLTGVWCFNVPQLVSNSYKYLHGDYLSNEIGSAISFLRVVYKDKNDNRIITLGNAKISLVLYTAIESILDGRYSGLIKNQICDLIDFWRCKNPNGNKPMDVDETKRIVKKSISENEPLAIGRGNIAFPVKDISVSSSHIVRLKFQDDHIDRFLRNFEKEVDKEAKWYSHHGYYE